MGRYKSTLGFIDLLFNLLIGYAYLFILAFILINPIAKKDTLDPKAEYLIILKWDPKSRADIDLWTKDGSGNIVSFRAKDIALMHLDRDDLGRRNDELQDLDTKYHPENNIEEYLVNREVISIRSKADRDFAVTVHYYNGETPEKVTVEIIQVNPYTILNVVELELEQKGVEKFATSFSIKNGHVTFTNIPERIATSKRAFMMWGDEGR